MIEIKVDMKKYKVEITGHANYDEKGKDIVCAGVSTLFFTLYNTLADVNEQMLNDLTPKYDEESGMGSVECVPKKEYRGNIQLIYMTVLTGLQLMADNYPDYVCVKGV